MELVHVVAARDRAVEVAVGTLVGKATVAVANIADVNDADHDCLPEAFSRQESQTPTIIISILHLHMYLQQQDLSV